MAMPLYYFILKSGRDVIPDREGVELPDLATARAHAISVARDLTRNRELSAISWRLEVCDDYLVPCFEILFADIDETITRFEPQYQESIKAAARISISLSEAFYQVRNSFADVRETLARVDTMIAAMSRNTGTGRIHTGEKP
jgi:hypothetical protein